MPLLLPGGSPFARPTSLPGFNPNHIAAVRGTVGFSGVGTTAGFRSLLQPLVPTTTGTVTNKIDPWIGAGSYVAAGGTTSRTTFTVSGTEGTMACIATPSTLPAAVTAALVTSTDSGIYFNAGSGFDTWTGSNNSTPGITAIIGVPYFLAISWTTATFNFIILRLDTGRLLLAKNQALVSLVQSYTSVIIDNVGGGTDPGACGVSAAMVSSGYKTLSELVTWSANPWSFWYPATTLSVVLNSLASPSPAGPLYVPLRMYLRR